MNRRNFFRALSALAALPLISLSKKRFADGGLVEPPNPAPLVGEHIHVYMHPSLSKESMRRITAAVKKGMDDSIRRTPGKVL